MRDQKLPNEDYHLNQNACFITLPQDLNLHKTQTIWPDKSYKIESDSSTHREVREIKCKGSQNI